MPSSFPLLSSPSPHPPRPPSPCVPLLSDFRGTGYISQEDLETFLRCLFRTLLVVNGKGSEGGGASADSLARRSAADALAETGATGGVVRIRDFIRWYTTAERDDSDRDDGPAPAASRQSSGDEGTLREGGGGG